MGSNIPLGLHAIPTRSTACPGCGRRRWAAGTSRFEAAWKYPDWLMNLLGLILPNSLGLIIFWIPYLMYVKHDDKPGKSINQLVFETWGLDHLSRIRRHGSKGSHGESRVRFDRGYFLFQLFPSLQNYSCSSRPGKHTKNTKKTMENHNFIAG